MSTYTELLPKVEQAWRRGDNILELLAALQGESNLPALGACIAHVYRTVRWGEANYIISVFCGPRGPLRLKTTPVSVSEELRKKVLERPQV